MNTIDTAEPVAKVTRELVVAALLAFYTFFGEFFVYGGVWIKQAFLISIALLYILSFLWPRRSQAGSVVFFVAAAAVYVFSTLLYPTFIDFILILAATISLVRILLVHRSLLAAIADAALTVSGVIAASIAYFVVGEFSAAVWSFFTVQALYPLINPSVRFLAGILGGYLSVPIAILPRSEGDFNGAGLQARNCTKAEGSGFKKALRSAEEALHAMESRRV